MKLVLRRLREHFEMDWGCRGRDKCHRPTHTLHWWCFAFKLVTHWPASAKRLTADARWFNMSQL